MENFIHVQENATTPNFHRSQSKVFMLLLDTADPQLLKQYMEMGQLPNFSALNERSIYSDLKSFSIEHDGKRYTISLPIIASIFTSRTPEEHGMVSHIFLKDGPDNYYPFKDLQKKSVWKILSEQGYSSGLVGTMGNYPVEKIENGFIASGEYLIKNLILERASWEKRAFVNLRFPNSKLLHPSNLNKEIKLGLPTDSEIDDLFEEYRLEKDFPPEIEHLILQRWYSNIQKDRDQSALRFAINFNKDSESAYLTFKNDAQVMAVAQSLYDTYRPDFFVEYHQGLDFYSMMYNSREIQDGPVETNFLLNYYKFFDQRLGEIMGTLDENTTLIVLSDHGVAPAISKEDFYSLMRLHSPTGILFISGKNINHHATVEGVTVYDIVPTILHVLGLPVARDMKGVVRNEIFTEEFLSDHPVLYTETYE